MREPAVLWLGLIGIGGAFFYHAPPLKLSYRGLGELTVAAWYGPLICSGAYLVQRGSITSEMILVSIPLGLLIGNFLLINEFPDHQADKSTGKRTLVVWLGRTAAARLYALVVTAAMLLLVLLPFLGGTPTTVWLGLVALPSAVLASRRLSAYPANTSRLVPAQAASLVTFVLYALGAGFGLLAG
jgi:1,4-dihydroxy-2-naphthoate octaprenyltransferase